MPPPINPIDCKHNRRLFIQDCEGGPPYYREHVTVCRDCGEFEVTAHKGEVAIVVRFTLPTWGLVDAAGQFARLLDAEIEREAIRKRRR